MILTGSVGEVETLETPVVVIGGGVSGCACAATLAEAGAGVTLVDPALDRLGEPSFGPMVTGGEVDLVAERDWLANLPGPLRDAWESATMESEDGSIVVVDRRLVGLRTKHALDRMEALRLRQGLVVEVGLVGTGPDGPDPVRRQIRLQTAFGEVLIADALVVAVGLGLGDALEGVGRASGEGLRESLGLMGAEFAVACFEVGLTFGGRGELVERETISLRPLTETRESWGEMAPESPYEREDLWRRSIAVHKIEASGETVLVYPDGLATREVAVRGGRVLSGGESMVVSRPGYTEHGLAVTNIDKVGRLEAPGRADAVWVAGRAAGSQGYVESLASGVRTGRAVVESLECMGLLRGEHRGS